MEIATRGIRMFRISINFPGCIRSSFTCVTAQTFLLVTLESQLHSSHKEKLSMFCHWRFDSLMFVGLYDSHVPHIKQIALPLKTKRGICT